MRDADGIDVVSGHPRHHLRRLDLLQHLDLITQARRLLVREFRCRLLHALTEVGNDLDVAAVEHLDGVGNVERVLLRGNQANTRPGTTIDLVLQAGARAVGEERVLAGAQPEQLLQQQQRLTRRNRVGIGAEKPSGQFPGATIERNAR